MKNLITQQDYDVALARGRAELEKPHAIEARFVGRTSMLVVKFSNGASFAIDARKTPHLCDHSLAVLKNPRVTAGGDGIIFDEADLALNLPILLAPFVPLEIARSRVAAESGSACTEKKAQAARANGAKGGRPRKVEAMA